MSSAACFILTVDVEWDRSGSRHKVRVENLSRLPGFQELCSTFGIRPTYLCAYEAARSSYLESFVAGQKDDEAFELGLHLHPWTTPPWVALDEMETPPYPSEYPLSVVRDKLAYAVEIMEQRFDHPVSYRAGRFGFSREHVPLLVETGIRVDSSVSPYVSWANVRGGRQTGPDYRQENPRPWYWWRDGTHSSVMEGPGVLEVPVTILPTGRAARCLAATRLLASCVGGSWWPNPLLRFLLKHEVCWLRPLPAVPVHRLTELIDMGVRCHLPVLVMFMHSNELHEECNPYYRTRAEVEKLLSDLRIVFGHVADRGLQCVTLAEYATIRRRAAEGP